MVHRDCVWLVQWRMLYVRAMMTTNNQHIQKRTDGTDYISLPAIILINTYGWFGSSIVV